MGGVVESFTSELCYTNNAEGRRGVERICESNICACPPVDFYRSRGHCQCPEADMSASELASRLREICGADAVIVDQTKLDDAHIFIENDPYYNADIWESIEINRVGVTASSWVGGKPW